MNRTSHEDVALQRFVAAARSRGLPALHSQRATNRILIAGGVYYQFGDLRVELSDCTVIVEVESSGNGTTNLAKYWEGFSSGRISKPLRLLHLFRQTSPNDYEAHMIVWRFLCEKMHRELAEMFEGVLFKYDARHQGSLDPAIRKFETWLDDPTASHPAA